MSRTEDIARERLAAALEAGDFSAAINVLSEARMTQKAIVHALGLSVSTWTLRNWRDEGCQASDEAWVGLDRLCADEGWKRAVEAKALYPDMRGRSRG